MWLTVIMIFGTISLIVWKCYKDAQSISELQLVYYDLTTPEHRYRYLSSRNLCDPKLYSDARTQGHRRCERSDRLEKA